MANTPGWLKGCGIGCLVLIVLNVVLIVGGVRFVRNAFHEIEGVSELQKELSARHGGIDDYVPPADGVIPADRLDVFLDVQADTYEVGTMLGASAHELIGAGRSNMIGPAKFFSILRGLRTAGTQVTNYLTARNTALLNRGMGLGEFTYINIIAYHAWLGHELLDIPGEADEGEITTSERLHDDLVAMMQRRRDALSGDPDHDPVLLALLEDEILEMRLEETRIPWQDNLPATVAAGLEPYRERLEEVYAPVSFLLGIGSEKDGGGFDFQFN